MLYLQCVADCAEFEIPTMVVHLPKEDNPCNTLGLDRIKRITEKAEQLGVNVALENLRNLANLAYVLEQVDSQRMDSVMTADITTATIQELMYYPCTVPG